MTFCIQLSEIRVFVTSRLRVMTEILLNVAFVQQRIDCDGSINALIISIIK